MEQTQTQTSRYPPFEGVCLECGGEVERYPEGDWKHSPGIRCYRCSSGHRNMVDNKNQVVLVNLPVREFKECPKCGQGPLKLLMRKPYPSEEGHELLRVFKCPSGHKFKHKQLIVRKPGTAPKELWEGTDY